MYGHVWQLAQAEAEGAASVTGTEVRLHRVPEILPDSVLEPIGALAARSQFEHVPLGGVELLEQADAIIVGTPTRFGNMAAPMRMLWDQTVEMWMRGALAGKLGSAFAATGTQHFGQETTLMSVYYNFFHHGMIIAGIPPTVAELGNMKEITGGGPYGAGTMSDKDGSRMASANELAIARAQGRHVAEIARRLFG